MIDKRSAIIKQTTKMIPFDGVSDETLRKACDLLGYRESFCTFPQGIREVLTEIAQSIVLGMQNELGGLDLLQMKVRERIKFAVKVCFLHYTNMNNYRELLKKITSYFIIPGNVYFANKILYGTVSAIWYAVGDVSTDFNYYTKRATLSLVYSATMLYFLNDYSENHEQTWKFLDRRIDNVMQFHVLKNNIKNIIPSTKIFDVKFS